jgi:DNA-binding transcriptional ArsR family regulator
LSTFSDDVAGFARELLRSLWAELGVEGAPRRHDWQAIDLEPLIVFTAMVADAALRDRTLSWCTVNSRHLSPARLNRVASELGQSAAHSLKRYTDALRRRSRRARVSVSPDLRRPSLIQLRLRALVGVTARAEVLRLLLAEPHQGKSAAAIAGAAGYGRAGLAQALDMLTVAGVATARREGDDVVYRLCRPSELAQALSGMPARFPDWQATFRVVAAILDYARDTAGRAASRAAAAAEAVERIREELASIPGASRPPRVTDEGSIAAFERWARSFVAELAGAHAPAHSAKREVTYTVHRLLLGGWIATVKEEGDQPRPLALSDGPELKPERRAKRRLKLDELGAAAEVIESIFYDLRTRELQRHRGSVVPREAVSDSLVPAMSREFAAELLRPMHKGQAANFTADFLERWSENRRDRFTAAG